MNTKTAALENLKSLSKKKANEKRSTTQVIQHHQTKIESDIESVMANFPYELRPYQVDGVEFMLTTWVKNSGILQGDDMGLGKTVQAITATLCRPDFKFTLYLTKPSLIDKTCDEWNLWGKKWVDNGQLAVIPIHPSPNKDQTKMIVEMVRQMEKGQVVFITNYESLNSFPFLADMHWDLLIVDEVHKLKGGAQYSPTKIWRNTKRLVWGRELVSENGIIPKDTLSAAKRNEIKLKPNVRHYLFMTGTFIVNGNEELWSYLNIFNPWVFDSLPEFKNLLSYTADGNLDVSDLLDILTPMMVRRSIEEVCEDLPEKIEETIYVTHKPDQHKLYQQLKEEFLAELPDGQLFTASMILEQMLRLRQINVNENMLNTIKNVRNERGEIVDSFPITVRWDGNEKTEAALDLIETLSENKERVVIFANFNQPLNDIAAHLQDNGTAYSILQGNKNLTGYFNGSSFKAAETGDLIDLWQNTSFDEGPQVFLINLASGAEGLNLQKTDRWVGGSSHVIMYDRWWNNARNNQAVARLRRMDTTMPVFVYWLFTKNSIDDFMLDICEAKQTIADGVVESQEVRYSKERLAELI